MGETRLGGGGFGGGDFTKCVGGGGSYGSPNGVLIAAVDGAQSGDGFVTIRSAIPEPSTWAMLLTGFAGLGFVGYRRNKASKDAA